MARIHRCRANMARIRQSRPDPVLGFEVKALETLKLFPLGSEADPALKNTKHQTPNSLHTPSPPHPTPHPPPHTPNAKLTPYTPNPTPDTRHPTPKASNPKPQAPNPNPPTPNPTPAQMRLRAHPGGRHRREMARDTGGLRGQLLGCVGWRCGMGPDCPVAHHRSTHGP